MAKAAEEFCCVEAYTALPEGNYRHSSGFLGDLDWHTLFLFAQIVPWVDLR